MNSGKWTAKRLRRFFALFTIHYSLFTVVAHATTVTGIVKDSQLNPVSNARVTLQLVNCGAGNVCKETLTGATLSRNLVTTTTASNGTWSKTVVGNDAITPAGSLYEIRYFQGPNALYSALYEITGTDFAVGDHTPVSAMPPPPVSAAYTTVAKAGSNIQQRQILNFTGSGVDCSDNVNASRTDCAISSALGTTAGAANFNWEAPTPADSGKWSAIYASAVTVTEVYCYTDSGGTVSLNFQVRNKTSPNTAGPSVLASSVVCNSNGASSTSFSHPAIAPEQLLVAMVMDSSGTPAVIRAVVSDLRSLNGRTSNFNWETPSTADSGKWLAYYSNAATITSIFCFTDAGTVNLNFEIRTKDAPHATGTTVLAAPVACNSSGATVTDILNDAIPANRILTPIVTATSGSPPKISAAVVTQ